MKNINREDNVPNTLRKTVVFGIVLLFVISSAMTIENVNSTTDVDENELEVRLGLYGLDGETWWNSSFDYRKLITINHSQVDATLTNFPVLVCRNADSDLSPHAQADGDDIAFVLYSDNSTKLNHEIENYSNGTLWTWVNVTNLSSSIDTKIWMYYGNATCSSQENVEGTWNSDYNAVYHMNNIASNDKIEDSTNNSYDSIETKGTPDYEQTGKISTAIYYVNKEAHKIPNDVLAENPTEFTVSCWINFQSFEKDRQHLITLLQNTYVKLLAENIGEAVYKAVLNVRNGGDKKVYGTTTLNTDTWYYIIGTYDGENITIYTNGSDAQSIACTSMKQEGKGNRVGAKDGERDNAYGDIDEVRISRIERGADWIFTCFVNQNDPGSFYSVGSEETAPTEITWDVILNFTGPGGANDTLVFGEASDASDGQDGYDVPKPGAPPSPYVYAWFDANLSGPYDKLWEDYRSYPDTFKVWDMYVQWEDSGSGNITISWDPASLTGSEYSFVTLKDVNADINTNMLLETNYTYVASDGVVRYFQIICSVTPDEYHYAVSLSEEWNLVSLPVNQSIHKDNITVNYLGVNYTWQQAVDDTIVLGFGSRLLTILLFLGLSTVGMQLIRIMGP